MNKNTFELAVKNHQKNNLVFSAILGFMVNFILFMKKMQKLAFQKHKNNIRNNKFRPKTNKIYNKHKK